eukprot:CAMPEP_0183291474 /NCGR_PEP_ID=MMETSP0160_2-20130417/883_1 /TAXON_ID=2839 ORGANISM="Odontella Sinensis, Strain Grunow 1884" /NCGR_SAMPLE_ID=MMETSP0160_2 /ASSEMBLY_ACC=CAM_ASM_000250 /LENGTH=635 /DNA_ID=CAMNT_0025452287 /DNA_START=158 /DNA_END=2061 /DNA_ORIENTATION=-
MVSAESTSADVCPKAVVKAAKRALKRADSGTMKIKALAKEVAASMSSENSTPSSSDGEGDGVCHKAVRRAIEGSGKFSVEGKVVSLSSSSSKRKRKEDEDEAEKEKEGGGGGDSGSGSQSPKKKRKKDKKKKKEKKSDNDGGNTDDRASPAPSSSSSSSSPPADTESWRKEHGVVLRDTRDADGGPSASTDANYAPFVAFAHAEGHGAAPLLNRCTNVKKFDRPSPIQAQCWPVLLREGSDGRRRDAVGIAETGSGKTLAFSLPALTAMYNEDRGRNGGGGGGGKRGRLPRMLVLAPTRELAMQSHEVLEEFGADVSLTSVVIYGGVPKHQQKSTLRSGVDCVVATPGRLKDLIDEGSVDLSKVRQLVLDEADRMLDMGFIDDVRYIVSKCTPREDGRRTAMFSATWPPEVAGLAMEYMNDPVRVYVGKDGAAEMIGENGEAGLSANKRVKQTVEVIEDRARSARLRQLLRGYYKGGKVKTGFRVLVFALYKKEAERLEFDLKRDGWDCASIHGNKTQEARTRALAEFKAGKCPLLIATDVAARGLDIPDVEAVVNYTFPLTIEDYVHRIGRTGRAGKSGLSHTFFQSGDKARAGELQQVLRQAGQEIPEELMKFGSTIKKKEHKLYGNFGPAGG